MRSQPAVQLLGEGTEPSAQPCRACESSHRPQDGPGRARDELQPVLNPQWAPREPGRSIRGLTRLAKQLQKEALQAPAQAFYSPKSAKRSTGSKISWTQCPIRSVLSWGGIPTSGIRLGVCPTRHTASMPFVCKGRQLKSRKSQGAFGKKEKKKGFIGICKDKLINSFNEGSKPQSLPHLRPREDCSLPLRAFLWCPCKLAEHEAMSKEELMTSALPFQSFRNAHLTTAQPPLGDGNHCAGSQNSQANKNSPVPLISSLCSAVSTPADAAGAHVQHTEALQLLQCFGLIPQGLDDHLCLLLRC